MSLQGMLLQRPAANGTFSETSRQKEENMMEMNRWWAPGADKNAIPQGDPKEDRLSNVSRNPQTFKEYKLTQSPVLVIPVLKEKRYYWFCNAKVLEPHTICYLVSYIFRKQEGATRLISHIRKHILQSKLRPQVEQKVVDVGLILCPLSLTISAVESQCLQRWFSTRF